MGAVDHPLCRVLGKARKRVLGLMSGTSVDGLDCALLTIAGHGPATQVLDVVSRTYLYEAAQREHIHALLGARAGLRAVCEGSFLLGEWFAAGALRFLREVGVDPAQVDLIGSHGQTVWHQPPSASGGGGVASTLQLGEPAVIAARTGVLTVADFRVADMALGGEGAPLVPYCDWLLFRRVGRVRALQNIGGIANVTLCPEAAADVLAFDNGPGNMMIDVLAERASGGQLRCDLDGQVSAGGQVQADLLAELLDDPYLRLPAPKSTGRERYGKDFTLGWLARHGSRRLPDLVATAVEFTAQAIAGSLSPAGAPDAPRPLFRPGARPDEVLVSGGGAHNRTLMRRLRELLGPGAGPGVDQIPVGPLSEGGVDVDCKEAVAFAVLAVQAIHGEPANLPGVTGARGPAVLGKICLPPPKSEPGG